MITTYLHGAKQNLRQAAELLEKVGEYEIANDMDVMSHEIQERINTLNDNGNSGQHVDR